MPRTTVDKRGGVFRSQRGVDTFVIEGDVPVECLTIDCEGDGEEYARVPLGEVTQSNPITIVIPKLLGNEPRDFCIPVRKFKTRLVAMFEGDAAKWIDFHHRVWEAPDDIVGINAGDELCGDISWSGGGPRLTVKEKNGKSLSGTHEMLLYLVAIIRSTSTFVSS